MNQVCRVVANIMSPASFSLPPMNACMPSSWPATKRRKSARLNVSVTRGASGVPCVHEPAPFAGPAIWRFLSQF